MVSSPVFASQTVPVVWPFSPASVQANHTRILIEEANKLQTTYTFVFQSKPGAGGAVAANYVLNYNGPAILAATSSFFIRPNLYPTESYDVNQFTPIFGQCSSPMVLSSKNFKSMEELKNKDRLTIGVSGLGATTHLFALELSKQFPNVVIVPFKGTPPAILAVLGDEIDSTTGFPGDISQFVINKDLVTIGVSGTSDIGNIKTFKSQGITGFENLTNNFSWMANMKTKESMITDWSNILLLAESSNIIRKSYNNDSCIDFGFTPLNSNTWFNEQILFWKSATKDVKLNQ